VPSCLWDLTRRGGSDCSFISTSRCFTTVVEATEPRRFRFFAAVESSDPVWSLSRLPMDAFVDCAASLLMTGGIRRKGFGVGICDSSSEEGISKTSGSLVGLVDAFIVVLLAGNTEASLVVFWACGAGIAGVFDWTIGFALTFAMVRRVACSLPPSFSIADANCGVFPRRDICAIGTVGAFDDCAAFCNFVAVEEATGLADSIVREIPSSLSVNLVNPEIFPILRGALTWSWGIRRFARGFFVVGGA
jgi:hypothetical protein